VHLLEDDGTVNVFTRTGDHWYPPQGVYDQLNEVANSHWVLTRKSGNYRRFEHDTGRLVAIGDSLGHETTIIYDQEDRLSFVIDAWERVISFSYIDDERTPSEVIFEADPSTFVFRFGVYDNYLEFIEFGGQLYPPFWGFTYTEEGRIHTFTDRDGHRWKIDGKSHSFTVTDPFPQNGEPLSRYFEFWWAESVIPRQHSVVDRRGNEWIFEFTDPPEPSQRALVHTRDPFGFGPYIQYDANLNVTDVTDALGTGAGDPNHTSHLTWDSSGNLTSVTDPLGAKTVLTYSTLNNLREVFPPTDYSGSTASTPRAELIYDDPAHPRLPSSVWEPPTEPNGFPASTKFYWNGPEASTACDGQLCGAGATDGTLARIIDANDVTHDYQYDCTGQLCSEVEAANSQSPLARWVKHDPAGRIEAAGAGLVPDEDQRYRCHKMKVDGNCWEVECENFPFSLALGGSGVCEPINVANPTQGCADWYFSDEGRVHQIDQFCLYDPTGEWINRYERFFHNELGFTRLYRHQNYDEPYLHQQQPWPAIDARWIYFEHDLANGIFKRKKPYPSTEDDLVVQVDARGLPQTITRNGVTITYAYDPDGAVHSVTSSGGPRTVFTYDNARRLTDISHQVSCSGTWTEFLGFAYDLTPDGFISSIEERHRGDSCGSGAVQTCTVSFDYDARGRLIHENRSDLGEAPGYDLTYTYDAGGNRLTKLKRNASQTQTVEYTEYLYDLYDSAATSRANRLLRYQVLEAPNGQPVRDTSYNYDSDGNVSLITKHDSGSSEYHLTSFKYRDHALLWLVVDEVLTIGTTETDCERTKIREFRYDGSGQLYMVQSLSTDPNAAPPLRPLGDAVWTEFDGAAPLRDITIGINHGTSPATPDIDELRQHQLGAWQFDAVTGQTQFYHTDHLGTTRQMTTGNGQSVQHAAFTAFGEPVPNLTNPNPTATRHGYVGALGYESVVTQPEEPSFPYLHLGARWYDPEIGRFLQRDPIGIDGGLNTYTYAENQPVLGIDPDGTSVLMLTGPMYPTPGGFVDRLWHRLLARWGWKPTSVPAGPATALGTALTITRAKGEGGILPVHDAEPSTIRAASWCARHGFGNAGRFIRRIHPWGMVVGLTIDAAIVVREIPFAAYGIPPGEY